MATPLEETGLPICYGVESPRDAGPGSSDGPAGTYRTAFRSLSAMQKEALVEHRGSGTAWRVASDEGDYLDGADEAPPPLGYMLAGMASDYAARVRSLADARGVDLEEATVVLDNRYSMEGSVLQGTMTAGALTPELHVGVEGDASDAAVADLVDAAVRVSPVTGLLAEPLPSRFTLTVNGGTVAPDRVDELDGPAVADPETTFEEATPGEVPVDEPLVRHTGELTEPLSEADDRYTERGDSTLADEHDRVVHLRGLCTEREDGTLHVRQKTYSPRASIFEFVADGPRAHGTGVVAPDPLSYLSAGIGFCFLTQMGRYASVVDRPLPAYRVVQDTRFTPGEVEGEPGRATPVDSHVFLETPEGDAFGREVLDMSEQSCYLHAICRSSVEPDVTVSRTTA